jgi:superfamily II DNA/RNA helicase
VALVVHADPPSEHKAYLHRSGRTARAGAAGTVVTLMTQDQVRDVRDLTQAAGIQPTITRVDGPRHPVLATLAPGERVLVAGGLGVTAEEPQRRSGGGRNRGRSGGKPRAGAPTGGRSRRRGGAPSSSSSSAATSGRGHSAASFSTGRR